MVKIIKVLNLCWKFGQILSIIKIHSKIILKGMMIYQLN